MEDIEDGEGQPVPASTADGASTLGDLTSGGPPGRPRGGMTPPPAYDGDKKPGKFENYQIRATLWLHTVDQVRTSARGPMLLSQLTGAAFESAKHLAKDRSWLGADDNGERLIDFLAQPDQFGTEKQDELLTALWELIYGMERTKGEEVGTFITRFRGKVQKLRENGVTLPNEALGFIMLVGFGVQKTDFKMLLTLTGGSVAENEVARALKKLESKNVRLDRGNANTSSSSKYAL
eukprot:351779-Alexandrium_andersonii.AAC.1